LQGKIYTKGKWKLYELFKEISSYICVMSDGRVQDTDATSRYSAHASGWTIHLKDSKPSEN
jgi:ABC-type microcin C transport system duplicated ATPase subunit YejF